MPSVFMEETNYTHNVRRVILQEKGRIEKFKDKHEH